MNTIFKGLGIVSGKSRMNREHHPASVPEITHPQGSVEIPKVVNLADDIPKGRLMSAHGGQIELSEDLRNKFALINPFGNTIIVMVVADEAGKPITFEIRRRVQTAGFHPHIVATNAEIIKIVYQTWDSTKFRHMEDATDVEKVIKTIIAEAHRLRASDIHIETQGDSADILMRVNGVRVFYDNFAKSTAMAIGKVLFSVHADADSKDTVWNPAAVSEASVEWTPDDKIHLQLRLLSSPIHPSGNFQIVIRVLDMQSSLLRIDQLGFSPEHLSLIDIILSGGNGMVLLCGPTNSGKSTTLQALISRMYKKLGQSIKITTVEDPVEYKIPGACQVQVPSSRKNPGGGSMFTQYLRSVLRQDADVVMVGEIRDWDSLEVTRDLILTGRKVFSTLHTTSALWAFVRLHEIGLPWSLLTMPGFISGIIYQRLLPSLCPHCSIQVEGLDSDLLPKDVMHRLMHVADFSNANVRVRGSGCEHCNGTGIAGRVAVSEIVIPDEKLLYLLSQERFMDAKTHWRSSAASYSKTGGKAPMSALQGAIVKMLQGQVDPVDIENQIALLNFDMVNEDTIISASEVPLLAGNR